MKEYTISFGVGIWISSIHYYVIKNNYQSMAPDKVLFFSWKALVIFLFLHENMLRLSLQAPTK